MSIPEVSQIFLLSDFSRYPMSQSLLKRQYPEIAGDSLINS